MFDRIKTSWFQPVGQPTRQARVAKKPLTDQLKPTVDERTSEAALQILENGAFDRVFDRLRTSALSQFTHSGVGVEGMGKREAAHVKITVLDEIKTEIQTYADELKLHKRKAD